MAQHRSIEVRACTSTAVLKWQRTIECCICYVEAHDVVAVTDHVAPAASVATAGGVSISPPLA